VNIKLVKPQMILLHSHKIMSKTKRMNTKMNKKNLKMKIKFMIKRKALIKREMRMMGIMKDQEQDHHTKSAPNHSKRSPRGQYSW
jgi:hypothetical protein